jgi:hypothetical protein
MMAYKDYALHGYVTNYGASGYQVWLSTNVATIGGTQYQCFITVRDSKLSDEGTLAMTTNQVFIWLDAKRPPKIIDAAQKGENSFQSRTLLSNEPSSLPGWLAPRRPGHSRFHLARAGRACEAKCREAPVGTCPHTGGGTGV